MAAPERLISQKRSLDYALVWLCKRLMAKYDIPPDRVVRHCDVRDTECPGDRFPFAWLQAKISQPIRTVLTTETQRHRDPVLGTADKHG
jgi:N-acetyl-anhydromuramyl-L-alanine amidase AmpD